MKVIKIGASWCSSCLVMNQVWEQIEKELTWLKTEYFDFDEDEKKVDHYKVKDEVIPIFIFFNDEGREIKRLSGEHSKKSLIRLIEKIKQN